MIIIVLTVVNGKKMFDTIKEEKRIFDRYEWCLSELFNINVIGVHLSKVNEFSPFDYHSSILLNKIKKIGLTEIRYTNKEIEVEEEGYISLDKKIKAVDTNKTNEHRIFISEQPSSLYIADLVRATWTDIKPSHLSDKAQYFDKYKTPHLIIPLRRSDVLNKATAYELRGCLVKEYKNINEAKSILIHMTDTFI